uniref:caspase recruitment domain-containing protein 11-like isoform X2 n=1 Tax=Myxine glutinosa TaxID=7769 RepID=UPI00358E4B13
MEVNNCGFNRESGIVELDEKPWYEFCCLEDSPWECLERLRDELTSNVDVTRLVPRLRACRVITHCEEDEIFSDLQLKNCRLRMGRLLDILYTKGEKGLQALFDSLERYYPELYHELTGKESTFPTQSESDAAPQWLLTELLNEKRLSCELKSTVAALERQQRLNLQDLQQSADKQNILKTENQEQQEELAKVKEENRELRVQISCLAQEKMALQLKCRELQFEGEQAVQALRWARTDCETERRQSQRLRRDRDLKPSSSTMIDLERQNAKLQAQLCQLSEDFNSQQNSNTKEQELLDQLFNLRQELQNTEELRDQLFEEKSASDIKSEALIEDCLVLQKRIKSLHVDLSEVEKEREQALTWRDEAQSMYSQCMQEKDRYRRQVRELEEKTDSLQHIISKAESTLCFDKDKRRYSELPMSKSEPNLCYKNPSDCSSPTESISSSSDLSTINMCSTSLPTSAFSLTKSLQMKAPSESCLPLLLSSPEHHQSLRPQSYRPVLQLTVSGPGCLKDQLNITGGNNLGIFVAAVQTDSAANGAGLRPQHQILALEADFGSGRDNFSLESCTKEEANWRLSRCNLPARVSVKHNPDGFMALGSTLRGGDSFYIRLNMELCPTLDGKGSLEATTGEILHVTDTLPQVVSWEISSDGEDSEGCGFWAAEKIDDRQHEPIKTGIIPNYKSAQKLLMSQTADSRSDFKHKRSWWRWWQPPRKMDKDIPKLRHTQQLPSVAGDTKSDDLCLKENEQPAPYVLVSPRQPTYQRPIVLIPELVSEALGGMLSMNPGFRMLSPVEVGSHSSVTGRYKKESVCREESFCVARLLKTKVEQMHLVLHGGLRMAWFLRKAGIHPIILCLHLISKGRKSLRKRLLDFPFGDKVLVKRLQEEEVLLWASSFQFVLVNPEDPGITTAKVVQLLVKKAHEEQERTVWVSPFTN